LDEQLLVQLHLIELNFNSIRRTFHPNLEPSATQKKSIYKLRVSQLHGPTAAASLRCAGTIILLFLGQIKQCFIRVVRTEMVL